MSQPISFAPAASKRLDRAEVAGAVDDHRVARIDQAARQQVEALLRAGQDEHAVGGHAEALRKRGAEPRLPLGRPVTPGRGRVASSSTWSIAR